MRTPIYLFILIASGAAWAGTVEEFEGGWPAAGWTTVHPPTGNTNTFAAHYGSQGYVGDGGWERNGNVMLSSPGDRVSMWVRHSSSAGSATRAYLGVGASTTGCIALVAGFNTNQLLFQRQTTWTSIVPLNSVAVTYASDTWYRMEVELESPVQVRGRLFAADGVTIVQTLTASVSPGEATGNGIAIRTFTPGRMHLDTICSYRIEPLPAGLGCTRILEDFETTVWPRGDWVTADGPAGGTVFGLAHDGSYSYLGNAGWDVNESIRVGVPGTRLGVWVRHFSAAGPPSLCILGFGADLSGAKVLAFDPNLNTIQFYSVGWTASVLNSASVPLSSNRWYRLEVEFVSTTVVRGRIYDEDGTTELASVGQVFPLGFEGGVVIRSSNPAMLMDTLHLEAPPLLEDFESPSWPSGNWMSICGGVGSTSTASAHDGERGYRSPGITNAWEYDTTQLIGFSNNRLSVWARPQLGRASLGFGADGVGCYSFGIAADVGEIRFEDNDPYCSSTTLSSAPFQPGISEWVRMEVEFSGVGPSELIGRVYGADGVTCLATLTEPVPLGFAPGGVAVHGFGGAGISLDTLEETSPGARCVLCPRTCGDGDADGAVGILDALLAARIELGLIIPTVEASYCLDVDASTTVNVLDALRIAQAAVGLPVWFNCR